jgi:geranylgeranyl reductase family protein
MKRAWYLNRSLLRGHAVNPERLQAECFDALVLGAGPAGSSAAYHLARAGARVLLVDRWEFPRDKACGDGIVPQAVAELTLLGITENELAHRFQRVDRAETFWPGMSAASAPLAAQKGAGEAAAQPLPPCGFVAPRLIFDDLLRRRALEAGADFWGGFHAQTLDWLSLDEIAVTGHYRQGEVLRLRARFLVAADGSSSRLARLIQQEARQRSQAALVSSSADDASRATAMRAYLPAAGPQKPAGLQFYLERADPMMLYFWIFPLADDRINVGVIATHAQLRADQHQGMRVDWRSRLNAFLARYGYDPTLLQSVRAAPLAMGLRGACLVGPRAVCVGDAAALISPLSAEGISGALASGRLAAQAIVDALGANTDDGASVLSTYQTEILSRYLSLFNRQFEQRRAREILLMALSSL